MKILEKVVQDGLSDKTKPRERLAIYIKLTNLVDDLMQSLQNGDEINKQDVDAFLTGLKLVKVESRFASR
jgi:predicted RNA-binding Zn ribbon-like protein